MSDYEVMQLALEDALADKLDPFQDVVVGCLQERLEELKPAPASSTIRYSTRMSDQLNANKALLFRAADWMLPRDEKSVAGQVPPSQLVLKLNEREGMFPQIDGTPQYQDKYEQAKHEQRKRRREELLRKWPVQEDWPVCPSDEAPMEESNGG